MVENTNFRFSFKLVTKQQKPLVQEWITQEHIKEWLHGDGLKNTLRDLDKLGNEPTACQHWLAYDNGVAFAYLITSDVEKSAPEEPGAITLDLFICRLDYIGKGFAVRMIQEFLLSQFPHLDKVFIDPEIANSRAVHVYKKAGFQIIDEFIAKWHPVPHYKMRLSMEDLKRTSREN